MSTNFGASADDYAGFRAGFPDSFFAHLASYGVGAASAAVVDLGAGAGALARRLALRGCRVIGVDPDQRLLDQARQLDEAASVNIEYKKGTAENIPLADNCADLVTAGQCWHWFDGLKAAAEIARILRAQGVLRRMRSNPLTQNLRNYWHDHFLEKCYKFPIGFLPSSGNTTNS